MDIATIGFKADTGSLDKGTASISKLKAAANGVTPAIQKIANAMGDMNVTFAGAALAMSKSMEALVRATGGVTKSQVQAAKEATAFAKSIYDAATAQNALAVNMEKTSAAITRQANSYKLLNAINRATGVTGLSGKLAEDSASVFLNQPGGIARDQMPNRFNTANIAAQFQDIGVTAAMGMNPMLVALQQGTQLSAIMNSMEKPLQGIGEAFKQIINPVSLLSIALTALAVVGLQMVDWTELGRSALYGLATAIEVVGPYAIGLAATLALAFAPSIIMGFATVTKSIAVLGYQALKTGATIAAAWVMANPITALTAIVAAVGMFATVAIQPVRDFVNQAIGLFVGFFNGIKAQWNNLPAALAGAWVNMANGYISAIETMINGTVTGINALLSKLPDWMGGGKTISSVSLGRLNNPYAEALADVQAGIREEITKAQQEDYVGIIVNGANSLVESATAQLRKLATSLGQEDAKKEKKSKTRTVVEKDPWGDLMENADRRIKTLEAEYEAIGKTSYETNLLKYETELLNDANQKGIDLDSAQTAIIHDKALQMAALAENTRALSEVMNLAKSATNGFLSDMANGLKNGENLWDTFGNAVLNVLNKILDKILEVAAEAAVSGFMGSDMGSSLAKIVGSYFSTAPTSTASAGTPMMTEFNTGLNSTLGFAKGGAFTNGIYDSPQLFAFANGGTFGVMGEAGPEAVMPLTRGPDGSLGVANFGGGDGGQQIVNVNIINNSDSQVSTQQRQGSNGMEIDVMIDQMVANNISTPGSRTSQAMSMYNSRGLTRR